MIKIGDTGLLEGLPPGIAEQHWVKVIDAVYRERLKKELKVIERIHVYTAIDSLPEDLLDVLAVQFKVDWYRDDYPVETKRRVIKTAMEVLKRWKKPLKTARLCMRSLIRSLTEQKAPRWHGAMRRGLSCLHWRTDPITQSSMPRTL